MAARIAPTVGEPRRQPLRFSGAQARSRCLTPTSGKLIAASALPPRCVTSMTTPSPHAGCSTSSPMRRPRAGGVARFGADALAGGDRRLDDPVAVSVAAIAAGLDRRADGPAPVRRRGAEVTGEVAAAHALATVRRAPGHVALGVDELVGDLLEEPRRRVVGGRAVQAAAPRVADEQAAARPRDADVGEAAFLLHVVGLAQRPAAREHALLGADEEHDRELQALGRVQREQDDLVLDLPRRAARPCRRRATPARGTRRRG